MHSRPGRPGRPLAFGTPDHGYAVNKQEGQVTLNMKELQEQMHRNGDYKLVHAYEKQKPNPRAKAALSKVSLFENSQGVLNSALDEGTGTYLALANLFEKDKESLKVLLKSLAKPSKAPRA